jgi:hypothetical protein
LQHWKRNARPNETSIPTAYYAFLFVATSSRP